MFHFIGYLLTLVIGVLIGAFFIGGAAGTAGFAATCKIVNTSVAENIMTQDQANHVVKTALTGLATEAGRTEGDLKTALPQIVDGMNRISKGETTPCQTALKAL